MSGEAYLIKQYVNLAKLIFLDWQKIYNNYNEFCKMKYIFIIMWRVIKYWKILSISLTLRLYLFFEGTVRNDKLKCTDYNSTLQ